MKRLWSISGVALALVALSLILAKAQDRNSPPAAFPASKVEWRNVFGKHPTDEKYALVLMAQEFMGISGLGAPTFASDLEEQIANWLGRHPNARVTPVHLIPLDEDVGFLHVWVVDGVENLNMHLVRRGCCRARNMQVSRHGADLLVTAKEYDAFERDLLQAENLAITEKLGVWATAQFQGQLHWQKAERFEEQKQFTDAISEFRAAMEHEHDQGSAWLRIARCYDKLGQYNKAIEAFDKAISLDDSDFGRLARIEKAEYVSRHEGPDKGAAVFGDSAADCSADLHPCLDLAVVHASQKRAAAAVETLERGVQAYIAHNRLEFVNDAFQLDQARVQRQGKYWESVQHLGFALPTLALYCFDAGEYDKAFRYASMSLSLQQAVKTHLADRFDGTVAEAGDFESRLVRAKVYSHRSSFEDAKRELDHAKVLIDVEEVGAFARSRLDDGYAGLQARFPDRKIEKPSTYKQRTEHKEAPSAEKLEAASEDELVLVADGNNIAAAFAALEELLARQVRGKLSSNVVDRLVHHGFVRQRDPKRQWLAQYGLFIEQTWDSGALPSEKVEQYVRHAVLPKLTANFAEFDIDKEHNVRLGLQLMIEPRVGGSLALGRDGTRKPKLSATVRILEVAVDGRTSPYGLNRDRDSVYTCALMAGSIQGRGFGVKNTRDLPAGDHTCAMKLQIEIRTGDMQLVRAEDLAAIRPLVVWELTASADFEVPG